MKRVLISPILRKSAWLLVLSLFSSFPSGAAIAKKKRRAASIHRVAARSTPSPLGTIRGGPWTAPTYANSTSGDNADGEDLSVRRAAVQALGPFNGSVVVVDPSDGRILSMVNQKMALGWGFQPCSTVKVSVALAALGEKLIEPQSRVHLNGRRMDLTHALAYSNNYFFATLGERLGFEKVSYYAHQFGYGEKAGLGIAGEEPGRFPLAPPSNGGVSSRESTVMDSRWLGVLRRGKQSSDAHPDIIVICSPRPRRPLGGQRALRWTMKYLGRPYALADLSRG
jgi:hypothetical protein